MKKIIVIMLCAVLVGCGVSQDEYDKVTSENAKLQETITALEQQLNDLSDPTAAIDDTSDIEVDGSESTPAVPPENASDDTPPSSEDVDVTTYALNGKYSNYGIFVVKNNTKTTLQVDINATFKDASGKLIGAKTIGEGAISGGQEIALWTSCDEAISSIECEVSTKKDEYYTGVIQNIKYETTLTERKCIVSATNSGKEIAKFAGCKVLFFNGKDLVGVDDASITDDEYELKPGKTRTAEVSCYEAFDSVKVYFTGRANK